MLKNKYSACDLIYPLILSVLLYFKSLSIYDQMKLGGLSVFFSFATIGIFLTVFALVSLLSVKAAKITITVIYFLISIFIAVDGVYYTYMSKLPSAIQLGQVSQLDDVSDTIAELIKPKDALALTDLPLWLLYFVNRKQLVRMIGNSVFHGIADRMKKKIFCKLTSFMTVIASVFVIVLVLFASQDFKFTYLEKNELFCYHTTDIAKAVLKNLPRSKTDNEKIKELYVSPDWSGGEYWGIAENRNVIIIQIEAFQNFLINAYYEGQEVTPTLNRLINEDSFYFDRYYYQIGGGNTADAEFAVNNSLFAPESTAAYIEYEQNDFHGLPWLLKDNGYTGAYVYHGYIESFWNRAAAYPKQGFDDFISIEDLDENDMFNMGLSDRQLYTQAMETLVTYEEPFYTFFITLSSHYPFGIPLYEREITLKPEDEQTLFGLYLQATNYTDRCIGEFLDMLDEAGILENSVIVLYGDHYALTNTDTANRTKVSDMLGRDYTMFDVFSVPLIIHIPGLGHAETIHTAGGHLDVMPTLLYLLGIKNESSVMFGQNLIEAEHGFVCEQTHVSRGSFINDEVYFKKPHNDIAAYYDVYEYGTMKTLDYTRFSSLSDEALKRIRDCETLLENNDVLINEK